MAERTIFGRLIRWDALLNIPARHTTSSRDQVRIEVCMDIEQARASALIAHASRVSFITPGESHPCAGLIVREYANATHYLTSTLSKTSHHGNRLVRHDFGRFVLLGKNRSVQVSEGFLHAWWNPDLPDIAGLTGLESCTLRGTPSSLTAWCAKYKDYVDLNMTRWQGPLSRLEELCAA